jgi:hypothetical protein
MSDAIRAPDEFQLSKARVDDDHSRLARRVFQLQTLNDASFELSRLVTSEGIADSFLLTAMGALGATQGFILIFGPAGIRESFVPGGFPMPIWRRCGMIRNEYVGLIFPLWSPTGGFPFPDRISSL